MNDHTLTRRGALAALGALAGCSAANPLGDGRTELDGAAIRALVDDSVPAVPERLPVGVGAAHLAASEERARALLDAVPASLGSDDLPNGAMREQVRRKREYAVESLDAAAVAPTPFERLDALADARAEARFAAGAWRAVDDGLTRDDMREEAGTVRDERAAFRERWRYLGGDPAVAVRVHAEIEERVDAGRADIALGEPRRYRVGNPLGVGEIAEEVERARVAVSDATHCYDRLLASVDEPTELRTRFLDARRTVRETFESERDDLPPVDAEEPWQIEGVDTEGTPAAAALEDLYRPINPRHDDDWDDEWPARSLHWAHASLLGLRAFASLRNAVADGETFAVESADDVAAVRREAIDAVRAAAAEPTILGRTALTDAAARLGHADDRLSEVHDDVSAGQIRNEVGRYLVVMARAGAVSSASERVVEALRS
ncbi:hypothetical protein [Haloplanus natans]|uniref:hypothetical protein n=1 Tax=Haloplanus natans TaxID=376171 RepID=UPI000677BAB5|nr:hypothetical protein [Haloplanus natans]